MRTKKRTVSETETHRMVIVRSRSMQAYCGGCRRNVEMVTIDRAAEALGISVPSLRERIPNSRGHFVESGGTLWVCWEWMSHPP